LFGFSASLHSPRRLVPLGLLVALAFAVLPAASANALQLINTDPCDNATLTQPFAPFGDSNSYKLVPGGDFEGSLSGWTLSGGAKRVSGSEPFGATGAVGGSSMYLPAGASVQTPYTCVDAAYPGFRLFGRNNGLLSTVAVSIVYKEPLVGPVAVPVGVIALSGSWAPSAQMSTLAFAQGIVNALLVGKTPQVALRFTAVTGTSQIDDVFLDPRQIR
jgi:predicted outer membrane lipoprotein